MEPISRSGISNSNVIVASTTIGDSVLVAPEISEQAPIDPATQVYISPAAANLNIDLNLQSRFASAAEYSAHATQLHGQWLTQAELESGNRRPFATAEDERLSKLSLKELMVESTNLPWVDEHGHSNLNLYGTEQGDRINLAKANILLKTQYDFKNAAQSVEQSLREFKNAANKKLGVDQSSFDIVFNKGKSTVMPKISSSGQQISTQALQKVQNMLDKSEAPALKLKQDIEQYNYLSWQMIDNELTQHIYGAEQNRYLPKQVSQEWLVAGINYAHVTTSNNLYNKYIDIAAQAGKKYQAALEDGSHFSDGRTDPGILEVTRMREAINLKV